MPPFQQGFAHGLHPFYVQNSTFPSKHTAAALASKSIDKAAKRAKMKGHFSTGEAMRHDSGRTLLFRSAGRQALRDDSLFLCFDGGGVLLADAVGGAPAFPPGRR